MKRSISNLKPANLSDGAYEILVKLILDADNWSGTPLWVYDDKESAGYLLDLKKKDYVTSYAEDACVWINLTERGQRVYEDVMRSEYPEDFI